MFKDKTNKELLKLMDIMMYRKDVKEELMSRITKYADGRSGNAFIKMFYIPKQNPEDIVVICRMGEFYVWGDLINDHILLPKDMNGRILWRKY